MEMFDHVPVALFVAVQQGLGVAPVKCGEAGRPGRPAGSPGNIPDLESSGLLRDIRWDIG